jgi:hypothetical protein
MNNRSSLIHRVALVAALLSVLAFARAADATGSRPAVPDAKTLASSTSQIAAWYRYARGLEEALAQREQQLADVTGSIGKLDSSVTAAAQKIADLDASIKAEAQKLDVLASKLTTPPSTPKPPTPPVINPPGPGEAKVGSTVTLTATCDGTTPITWQWKKNGSPVEGWTSDTITLISITTNDTAEFTAVATNDAGSAESSSFKLTVVP